MINFMVFHCNFKRFCKSNNTINVFCSCPHVSFLSPPMNEWIHFVPCIDVQNPHTLWTMKFMACTCNEINIYFGQVDGEMAHSLNRV